MSISQAARADGIAVRNWCRDCRDRAAPGATIQSGAALGRAGERRSERPVDADHRLGIVLAADLVEHLLAGFDRLAARRLGRRDQRLEQGMRGMAEKQPLRQHAGFARLGEDPQALGQEQPLGAPVLLVAKRARLLHQRVGKGRDLPRHGLTHPRGSVLRPGRELLDRALGAEARGDDRDRVAHRGAEHHRPMTRCRRPCCPPSVSPDRGAICEAKVTNLGVARAWRPRCCDLHGAARHVRRGSPRTSEARNVLRPASRGQQTAERTSIVCGRLPGESASAIAPAINRSCPVYQADGRLEGVPPNRSVRG